MYFVCIIQTFNIFTNSLWVVKIPRLGPYFVFLPLWLFLALWLSPGRRKDHISCTSSPQTLLSIKANGMRACVRVCLEKEMQLCSWELPWLRLRVEKSNNNGCGAKRMAVNRGCGETKTSYWLMPVYWACKLFYWGKWKHLIQYMSSFSFELSSLRPAEEVSHAKNESQ